MRPSLIRLAAACLIALAPPALAETSVPASQAEIALSFAPVAKAASPAVVNIYATVVVEDRSSPFAGDPFFRQFFEDFGQVTPRLENSLGSGVIVSADGLVVSNYHLVGQATEIRVVLADRREYGAKVLLADRESDLAVLRLEGAGDLPALPMRNSDEVEVGELVLAIGNPFGVGQSVTFGIIGATGRAGLGLSTFENFIQTDATIHPGNSGGALVNAEGRLVGINSAVYSQQGGGSLGIGFAIPAAVAYQVMQALIDHGRVVRGWLGIEVERVELPGAATAKVEGLRVTAVVPGSPAEQAGIAENDIITRLSGRESWNGRLAMEQIARARPGEQVRISVLRGSEPMELTATVGERPPAEP